MKKKQALFSSKDKSKKLECRLLQVLFGALMVNMLFALVGQTTVCRDCKIERLTHSQK